MKPIIIEMPNKLTPNFFTIQTLTQINKIIETAPKTQLKLSFKKTHFIDPTLIAALGFLIDLAKEKGHQVFLVALQVTIKTLLVDYKLLKTEKKQILTNKLPFQIFEYQGEAAFESYLKHYLPNLYHQQNYIPTYLKYIYYLLAPKIACNGCYNSNQTWLFFTIISKQTPELNDFKVHLIVEELKLTGGKLWAAQGQYYYDLKETHILKPYFPKTLLIIGFPLGTLPS